MLDREALRRVISATFDAIADEHPLKHQNVYGRRYLFHGLSGREIELMFEASPKTPPNIWMLANVAAPLIGTTIKQESKPASELRAKLGKNGEPLYGRHSALETMPQLGEADLVKFAPENAEEFGRIVDVLLTAS